MLSIIGSISYADVIPPMISSVIASPDIAAAGDMIHITVVATDDTSVSSVTADSLPLQQVGSVWQGYVPAKDQLGTNNVAVIATDASGNNAIDTGSHYTTALVAGIRNINTESQTVRDSASRTFFKVWGRATYVDTDNFDVDDGSGNPVRVTSPGHIVRTGDYATARGRLQYTESDVSLIAYEYDIPEFAPGTTQLTSQEMLLGNHLQLPCTATLGAFTPVNSPVNVTLTSLDPGRLLLGTSSNPKPSSSVTINTNAYYGYTILGLADSGTVSIAAISSDGQRGMFKVKLAPTGFVFYSPFSYTFGDEPSVDINRYGRDAVFGLKCAILDPTTHSVVTMAVNSGCLGYMLPDVSITLANSNPSTATIITNPLILKGFVIPNDVISYTDSVRPLDFGTTTLSINTPPGFTTPSERQQVTVNVIEPSIWKSTSNHIVGRDLQVERSIHFYTGPSPQADITLTVDDSSIATISADPALEGSGSITINGANNGKKYYIQGRGVGTTTLTISAPGYQSATDTIIVRPSGFVLSSSNITTNKYATNSTVAISSAMLAPDTLKVSQYQNLRGGLSVNVPLSVSDSCVGVVTPNPAVMLTNTPKVYTGFDPVDVGACTISLGAPDGFQTPSEKQQISATVNTPKIIATSYYIYDVGRNLQTSWQISLESAPPAPVDISVSVDDSSIVLVSASATSIGTASIVFAGVNTTSSKTLYIQGLSVGETNIRISAPGYSDKVILVKVFPSGFVFQATIIQATTMSPNKPFTVSSGFRYPDPISPVVFYQPLRPGVDPVNVAIQCSDTSVGTVTVNPLVFAAGSQYVNSAFDPMGAGDCTLSLIQPDGYQVINEDRMSIDVNVREPDILSGDGEKEFVGVNLQAYHTFKFEMAPHSPVNVTITVADCSIAVVSKEEDKAGTSSCTISNVSSTSPRDYYFQGISEGTTTLTLSAPGYADKVLYVEVKPSGFAFYGPYQITVPLSTASTTIRVDCNTIDDSGDFLRRPIRGGLSDVYVPVSCSNPNVGTITGSPLRFTHFSYDTHVTFTPKAVGTCDIWLTPPTGWSAFTGYDRVTVTVTP